MKQIALIIAVILFGSCVKKSLFSKLEITTIQFVIWGGNQSSDGGIIISNQDSIASNEFLVLKWWLNGDAVNESGKRRQGYKEMDLWDCTTVAIDSIYIEIQDAIDHSIKGFQLFGIQNATAIQFGDIGEAQFSQYADTAMFYFNFEDIAASVNSCDSRAKAKLYLSGSLFKIVPENWAKGKYLITSICILRDGRKIRKSAPFYWG